MTQLIAERMGILPTPDATPNDDFVIPTRVGVELEYEQAHAVLAHGTPDYVNEWWSHGGDGSLRGEAVELRFRSPYAGEQISEAIASLDRMLSTNRYGNLVATERCGTHVHADVCHLPVDRLAVVAVAYALLEPYIFDSLGENREINPFCPPWYHADPGLLAIRRWNRDIIKNRIMWRNKWQKYSSLNLAPIAVQGSIEFRMFPSTLNTESVKRFVLLSQCIVSAGTWWESAADLLDQCFDLGWAPVLERAFENCPSILENIACRKPEDSVIKKSWEIAERIAIVNRPQFGLITEVAVSNTIGSLNVREQDPAQNYVTALQRGQFDDRTTYQRLEHNAMDDDHAIDISPSPDQDLENQLDEYLEEELYEDRQDFRDELR